MGVNVLKKIVKDLWWILAFITIGVVSLTVAGCDFIPESNKGADGYRFGEPQYENSSVTVSTVVYASQQEMDNVKRDLGISENVVAFSVLSKNNPAVCTIHMLDPTVKYEPEFVGHEFLHCVYGQWHTSNEDYS